MDMHMALLLTTLAGLSTGLGGLVVWLMRTPGPRIMALSQGFAAGVMMTVSLSEMLPSAVEAYAASGAAPVGAALRGASLCAAGMLAALLLEKSLAEDEARAQRRSVPGKTLSLIHSFGVGFLAGLLAATPDMRYSGDRFFDETHMYLSLIHIYGRHLCLNAAVRAAHGNAHGFGPAHHHALHQGLPPHSGLKFFFDLVCQKRFLSARLAGPFIRRRAPLFYPAAGAPSRWCPGPLRFAGSGCRRGP